MNVSPRMRKPLALSALAFVAVALASAPRDARAHGDVDEPVHVAGQGAHEEQGPQDELDYQAGGAAPAGYHLERRPRHDTAVGGLGLAVAGYVPAAGVAIDCAIAGCRGTHAGWELALLVPVAGPLIYLPTRCVGGERDCVIGTAFWIADAAVQALGVTLWLYGARAREVWVRDGSSGLGPSERPAALRIAPRVLGDRGYGLGVLMSW